MSRKGIKRQWHIDNKPYVWDHFKGVCQECKLSIPDNIKWDIHHIKYSFKTVSVYSVPASELIPLNIITLVCRPCHDQIHTASDINNPGRLENKAPCEFCGRAERGMFDRKRSEKLDKLLCRTCFLNYRNGVRQMTLF
jgi:hypothetical protein